MPLKNADGYCLAPVCHLLLGSWCSSPAELVQRPNFATSMLMSGAAAARRTYNGNRIAVRFEYEFHDESGQWFRAHGNEVCLAYPSLGQGIYKHAQLSYEALHGA